MNLYNSSIVTFWLNPKDLTLINFIVY